MIPQSSSKVGRDKKKNPEVRLGRVRSPRGMNSPWFATRKGNCFIPFTGGGYESQQLPLPETTFLRHDTGEPVRSALHELLRTRGGGRPGALAHPAGGARRGCAAPGLLLPPRKSFLCGASEGHVDVARAARGPQSLCDLCPRRTGSDLRQVRRMETRTWPPLLYMRGVHAQDGPPLSLDQQLRRVYHVLPQSPALRLSLILMLDAFFTLARWRWAGFRSVAFMSL